jgi:hypothetical protein
MKRTFFVRCSVPVLFTALLLPEFSVVTVAQTPIPSSVASTGWVAVRALPAQTRIRITPKTGDSVTCFVDSVTDDRLSCSSSPSQTGAHSVFARDEVRDVRLTSGGHTAVYAVFGALGFGGVGAGIGLAIGGATSAKPALVGAAGGVAVGALIGAAFGHAFGKTKGSLVYRSH